MRMTFKRHHFRAKFYPKSEGQTVREKGPGALPLSPVRRISTAEAQLPWDHIVGPLPISVPSQAKAG